MCSCIMYIYFFNSLNIPALRSLSAKCIISVFLGLVSIDSFS